MTAAVERFVIRLLRIPPEPRPASTSDGETRTFRASRRYLLYRLTGWTIRQLTTATGILAFLWFTGLFDVDMIPPEVFEALREEDITWPEKLTRERFVGQSILDGIWLIEIVGITGFLIQLPISYAIVRLDYRLRWYVLTESSLHLRSGVRHVQEQTLTFANIQNVQLEQGPIDRLFGFAAVTVHTAGGGPGGDGDRHDSGKGEQKSLHVGWLRGLDDAEAVRDRILAAVRPYRDAGLGHPDEPGEAAPGDGRDRHEDPAAAAETAARELLDEVRAWRRSLEG